MCFQTFRPGTVWTGWILHAENVAGARPSCYGSSVGIQCRHRYGTYLEWSLTVKRFQTVLLSKALPMHASLLDTTTTTTTTTQPNNPTTRPPNHPTTQPPDHPTTQPTNHPTNQQQQQQQHRQEAAQEKCKGKEQEKGQERDDDDGYNWVVAVNNQRVRNEVLLPGNAWKLTFQNWSFSDNTFVRNKCFPCPWKTNLSIWQGGS